MLSKTTGRGSTWGPRLSVKKKSKDAITQFVNDIVVPFLEYFAMPFIISLIKISRMQGARLVMIYRQLAVLFK